MPKEKEQINSDKPAKESDSDQISSSQPQNLPVAGTMFNELKRQTRIIDQLRSFGLDKIISLPKICVIGAQSAGKSSVLE